MKLATPKLLRDVTGKNLPREQYEVLVRDFRLNPYFRDGVIVISEGAIDRAFDRADQQPKPRLNLEA